MRPAPAKRSASSLLALSAMLLTLGFAGVKDGIVLCLGDDGHVAIEAAGPWGCTEVEELAAPSTRALANPVSSSHCGPCVDVAISPPSTTEAVKSATQAASDQAAAFAAKRRAALPQPRALISYEHFRPILSAQTHTVVLRC